MFEGSPIRYSNAQHETLSLHVSGKKTGTKFKAEMDY